jgi:hypothetical protein
VKQGFLPDCTLNTTLSFAVDGDLFKNSFAVADPEIEEVLDLSSGAVISARQAIGSDYDDVIKLRMTLRTAIDRQEPIYACPLCHVPVYLVSLMEKRRFFFRHELEDGRCPARTRGELSQDEIDARKYNGAKESRDHIHMKEIISESLRYDPRFSDISVEKVWKSRNKGEWRRPDVQAIFGGRRIAFEVQLSTTFLRVIAQRREFYLREGGLLLWVFKTFNEEKTRLTQDDVFYNNNHNAFLVSDETLRISKETGTFTLECLWTRSVTDQNSDVNMERRLISFSDLTFDYERQRVFYFDYDEHRLKTADSVLRNKFETFWLSSRTYYEYDAAAWSYLCSAFRARGIPLPKNPYNGDGPMHLLNALYSAKHGRPVGWRFKKLIEVAHRVHDGYKNCLPAFRLALAAYGRAAQIEAEDISGKWRIKVERYRPLIKSGSPEYAPERRFDRLIAFLFPEIPVLPDHSLEANSKT